MTTSSPYFFSVSLKSRFAQDIQDAIKESRIDNIQARRLSFLLGGAAQDLDDSTRLRVDRLVMDDESAPVAELCAALLISDPDDNEAELILSTPLSGIEAFESRPALLAALKKRFDPFGAANKALDAEHVESQVFEVQMRQIIHQQATHLEGISTQLHALPDLRTVLGNALSERLASMPSALDVDAFSHPVLLVNTGSLGEVAATQCLVDVALDEYVAEALPEGLKRHYLDVSGQALSERQTQNCTRALSDTNAALASSYEQALTDFWASTRSDGRSVRDYAAHALADSFRHHLLSARNKGSLTQQDVRRLGSLLTSSVESSDSEAARVRRLSVAVAGQEPVKLAGLLLIDFTDEPSFGVYLFSSRKGFRHFAGLPEVTRQFASGPTELMLFSSLNDHALIAAKGDLQIHAETITGALFFQCMDSIIALQKRSLRHVLGMQAIGRAKTPVRIDDALDIRALLDGRLAGLHDPGRWRSGDVPFAQIWDKSTEVPVVSLETLDTWAGKLHRIETVLERVSLLHQGVDGCMRQALNHYLALIDGPRLDARSLWVSSSLDGSEPAPLLLWALDRIFRPAQATPEDDIVMQGDLVMATESLEQRLPIVMLEEMLVCIKPGFADRFEQQIVEFYSRQARYLDTCVQSKGWMERVREYSLRLELMIEKRLGRLSSTVLDGVQQVLDRPAPALREALGAERVEGYSLSIQFEGLERSFVLPNTFVICKPGQTANPIMWMLGLGLRHYDSIRDLESWVSRHSTSRHSPHVLELLAKPDRQAVDAYLKRAESPGIGIVLHRIEGHFIETLQAQEVERQRREVTDLYQRSIKRQLPSSLFRNLMGAAERDDGNRHALNSLAAVVQEIIYNTVVPQWVSGATTSEQVELIDILQRFLVTCVDQKDFLFKIPSLYEYARDHLSARLDRDFPHQMIEPETIIVSLKIYIGARVNTGETPGGIPQATQEVTQDLCEYSVSRFMAIQGGTLSLSTKDGKPLSKSITPDYVRNLVSELDVAAGYRGMLATILVKDDATYPERQKLFAEQTPALDMLRAITLRLRKELSVSAYHLIEAVLNMPDGVARLPVKGQSIFISPLLLLPATEGWEPTKVTNVYVIAPALAESGPWLLYAPLHTEFVFKEYPNQAGLLKDIHTSASLQAFILDRIDPQIRKVYNNGGFVEPHLPFNVESSFDVPLDRPRPVTLHIEPYNGNALDFLFEGSVQALKLQVQQQSVTNAELQSTAARYLFGLILGQIMLLLPGRIGALVGIWQSQNLFGLSVVSAGERRWGEAVGEFIAALSMLITSGINVQIEGLQNGDGLTEITGDDEGPDELPAPGDVPAFPVFTWANGSMTQQIRERLRQFEARDVALDALKKDELFNIYKDPATGKKYAAIGGKAFELRSDQDGWFIATKDQSGPSVVLDENQQWKLDLGLKGGGAALTRLKSDVVNASVDEVLAVDTEGMPEIRRTFRGMAISIEEGHAQAQLYLENCLDNLRLQLPDGSMDPRVQKILADYFSTENPGQRLHNVVRQSVTQIYEALMDPSLSPIDSPRYVVGVNRNRHDSASAFTFVSDPQKRIFLTEDFFRQPYYRLKLNALRSGGFRFGNHYRASILIHELSHLVLDTEDIAYVDAHAPFLDLLEDAPSYYAGVKREQVFQQQQTLSYQADRNQLFKQVEDGSLRDLKRADGGGKKKILKITGTNTLDQARDVFYDSVEKRTDVMLSNADSVALLVTLLGRERFAK